MKVTKYQHACFTVEKDNQVVIVDPGGWTTDLIVPDNVVAIIITHEHADHCEPERLTAIIANNPSAKIFAHESIGIKLPNLPTQDISAAQSVKVGSFVIEFFGGQHATIHASYPAIANLGVLINQQIYYPGDSFAVPGMAVDTLLLPISAPWLKVGEVLDFVTAVKPRLCIPTHDAILSDTGKALLDSMVSAHCSSVGSTYQRLDDRSIVLE